MAQKTHEMTLMAEPQHFAARLVLKTEIERSDEGAHMAFITMRAVARGPGGLEVEVGKLTAWRALYANLSSILADPSLSGEHIVNEFDEISYDGLLAALGMMEARATLASVLQQQILAERPNALVYIEQVVVHPAVRGQRLGLAMMRELKALMSGSGAVAILKAIPIDTPYDAHQSDDGQRGDRLSDTQRSRGLQAYYRSDSELGFCRPARCAKGGLLAACWSPLSVAPHFEMSAHIPRNLFQIA
jgi:GNAT superfamily N-acetyltransferase